MRLTLAEGGEVFLNYFLPHLLQFSEGSAHCRLKVMQKPVCGSVGSVERHEFVEEVIGFPSFEVFIVALPEYFTDDPFIFFLETAEGHLPRELLPLTHYFLYVSLLDLSHTRQEITVGGQALIKHLSHSIQMNIPTTQMFFGGFLTFFIIAVEGVFLAVGCNTHSYEFVSANFALKGQFTNSAML
jgi:hypothetical protein